MKPKPLPPPTHTLDAILKNPMVHATRDDYVYRSGWTGAVMGQQFKLDTKDAQALLEVIEQITLERQKALLTELHDRTESRQATGSVGLTASAAAELNAFAARLGMNVTFKSGQQPPGHPIG